MTCRETEGKLTAYQEGLLSPEEGILVKKHLAACAQCSSVLAELKKTVTLVKNLPEVEPPPWFTQKIMAQVREVEEQRNGLLKKLFCPFHIKIPLELFATLCVVALGLYVYKTSGPEISMYQAPSAVIIEAPVKDMAVSKPEDRQKTIVLPKTKPDNEVLMQKESAPQPPVQTDEHKAPSETTMGRREEPPAATRFAPDPPPRSITKEKDTSMSIGTERIEERAKKVFQLAPQPGKTGVSMQAGATVSLFVEDNVSASMEIEKVLDEYGITVTKREFRDGVQFFFVKCPAQKLQWLLRRLRTMGDVEDSPSIPDALNGDLLMTIRIVSR